MYGKGTCPVCGAEFQKHAYNHVYDSEDCQIKARKLREAQRRGKKPICICEWCKMEYRKPTCKRFCSQECRSKFDAIRRRIQHLYPFQHRKVASELAKLKKLGGQYRFSGEHEGFNDYYRLKLLAKAIKDVKEDLE